MLRNKRDLEIETSGEEDQLLSILQQKKDKTANDYWWSDMTGENFPQSEEAFYIGANTKYGKQER